jgi:DNA-binding response OmpR family regulator
MRILLASARAGALSDFVAGFVGQGVRLELCPSGENAVAQARAERPDLVVIDEDLPDLGPGRLVIELLQIDAAIDTAVLSALADDQFHERTEGLGILARVPRNPTRADAAALLATLRAAHP